MYDKIVVPLDGSELAEVALPYAVELAGKMGSEIVLLSVLESAVAHEHDKRKIYLDKIVEDTKQHAEKHLVESGGRAIKIGAATRVGYPAEGIISYASKGDFDLIIIATHGRSGLGRWALGSVADKVVRTTTRQPVMLIRAGGAVPDVGKKDLLKKVLVPLDGSMISEAVISYVRELAHKLKSELTLLQVVAQNNHISADAESYLKRVCGLLGEKGITARYEVRVGAAADVIINLADELKIDMVAMSTHGRSGVARWVLGSVAQKVLLGGNTPLLLVRY
jgi:nucleotide-binding universal stress UspA family protein